jgi:uncharacterized protein
MQATPNDRTVPPASPCINVCVLDGKGLCLGCLRSGDEIARWRDMSAAEQWRLLDRLAERRAERAAPVSTGVAPLSEPPGD